MNAIGGTTRGVLRGAIAGLLLVGLSSGAPAQASVVQLENTAPLRDHSDGAIQGAIERALDGCVRAAREMQLTWVSLQAAVVLPDRVRVRATASDEEAADEDEVNVIDLAWVEPPASR
jgi:hypothetical protein